MQLRRKRKISELPASKKAIRWKGKPCVGQKRVVKRFAWFPTRTDSGIVVWLERYLSYEEYCHDWEGYKWKVWKREAIPNNSSE